MCPKGVRNLSTSFSFWKKGKQSCVHGVHTFSARDCPVQETKRKTKKTEISKIELKNESSMNSSSEDASVGRTSISLSKRGIDIFFLSRDSATQFGSPIPGRRPLTQFLVYQMD